MFKNEAEFSKWVVDKFKKCQFDATRIESHGTCNGIPDMYIQGFKQDWFIELKCDKKASILNDSIIVKWRPGQQAWARRYFLNHCHKAELTMVACEDGIIFVPMHNWYGEKKVDKVQGVPYKAVDMFTLPRLVYAACKVYTHFDTYEEAVMFMLEDCKVTNLDFDMLHADELLDLDVTATFDSLTFNNMKMDAFHTMFNASHNQGGLYDYK